MKYHERAATEKRQNSPTSRCLVAVTLVSLLMATIVSETGALAEPVGEVDVASTDGWQSTSIPLAVGTEYSIAYVSGTWTVDASSIRYTGPSGLSARADRKVFQGCKILPSARYGTLLGRLGTGQPFVIGGGGTFTALSDGVLDLRINDADECLGDNAGSVRIVVDGPPPLSTPIGGLVPLIDAGDRLGIREYLRPLPVASINEEVAVLDDAQRSQLAAVILDSGVTGDRRARLLAAMEVALNHPDLRFYAEVWSYTRIDVGDVPGLFFVCSTHPTGYVNLEGIAFDGMSFNDVRNVLLHESFHAFNCHEGGPDGALNEGAAVWVFKAAFPDGLDPAETFAEATYGTKLFYRDIGVGQPDPNYPLTAPDQPSAKYVEVLTRLSEVDTSRLPWNSQSRLVSCFQEYWEEIDRNQEYQSYLELAEMATTAMLEDMSCRPL